MLQLLGVGALLLVPGAQHRPAPRRRCRACVAAEPVPLPTSPKDVATQMSYAVQARTCPTHLRRSYVLLSDLFSFVLGYVLSYVVSHASAQPMDVPTPCRQRSKEIATDIAKKGIARRRLATPCRQMRSRSVALRS